MKLKTDFETLEAAIAYLKGEAQTEVDRLTKIEEEEKPALLRKRDELLAEAKQAKEAKTAAEAKVTELESKTADAPDVEAKYRSLYEQDKADFQKQLDAMKAEREAEKQQATAAQLKASAIAELSKPTYGVINSDHFYRLHGDKIALDPDTGELYIDLGDYKRQTVSQFVEDVAQRPEEQHLFKPKGGKGSDSPGSGNPAPASGENPFKTGNITEQGRLFRTNRAMYDRLKAEAGK